MIETKAELLEWIDQHPQRHQQTGLLTCSCGWDLTDRAGIPDYPVTWRSHFDAMLLRDLGDVLASDSHGPDGPQAWASLVKDLYRTIDIFNDNCTCDFDWPGEATE